MGEVKNGHGTKAPILYLSRLERGACTFKRTLKFSIVESDIAAIGIAYFLPDWTIW